MNILEVTLSIGIGIALAAAAMTQISFQAQTLIYYKDVDYYSREVPRTIAALQNISRGAHTYRVGSAVTSSWTPPTLASPGTAGAVSGDMLTISSRVSDKARMDSVVWLLDKVAAGAEIDGDFIYDPVTKERSFQENRFDLCVSTRVTTASAGGGTFPDGWVLNKNIAGVRFDIIPNSGGTVLMTVLKRMRGDSGVGIAFQTVLERR